MTMNVLATVRDSIAKWDWNSTYDCVPGLSCKRTCRVCARKRCRGIAVEFGVPVFLQSISHKKAAAVNRLERGIEVTVFRPRNFSGYRWMVEAADDDNHNIVRIRLIAADLCLTLPFRENRDGGQPILATCLPEAREQ